MKASHNSLTGYPIRKWYMKPFSIFAKCQDMQLGLQLVNGVRYFDLRFRYVDGQLYAAHGLMTFDCTAKYAIFMLNKYAGYGHQIYFRAILEDKIKGEQISLSSFRVMINDLMAGCSENLKIHRLGLKSDWSGHIIYNHVEFLGTNNFSIFGVYDKIREMKRAELCDRIFISNSPYVYECYSYKTLIPRLSAWLINRYAPDNSMTNFVK